MYLGDGCKVRKCAGTKESSTMDVLNGVNMDAVGYMYMLCILKSRLKLLESNLSISGYFRRLSYHCLLPGGLSCTSI